MATYKTPGVYVQEISTLPPSVASVATAIPAFIGYTQTADRDGQDLTNVPTRIGSLPDYERLFGRAQPRAFVASNDALGGRLTIERVAAPPAGSTTSQTAESAPPPMYLMYYALRMYFANGGGPCYIVSVGRYGTSPAWELTHFQSGLKALRSEDEPTLIVFTDAVNLAPSSYKVLCEDALKQCGDLKDRFTIMDVPQNASGTDSERTQADSDAFRDISSTHLKYGAAYYPYLQTVLNYAYDEDSVTLDVKVQTKGADGKPLINSVTGTLTENKDKNTQVYNQVKAELQKQRIELPPSCAMAGIYAKVDRERGVWKAPANVGVTSVIGPSLKITATDQDDLNIDPTEGKSINAIRTFVGKGTLVWGARTLAGNDNEWRYVNVRRLFNMIEESTQKASAFAVFEANDATTWLKVKGMIESFLYGLWEQGALAGPTPDSAYFVNVGLGTTMTTQDILEGRMNVEIGVAAVRPAEFIILKFSHKLQEA